MYSVELVGPVLVVSVLGVPSIDFLRSLS